MTSFDAAESTLCLQAYLRESLADLRAIGGSQKISASLLYRVRGRGQVIFRGEVLGQSRVVELLCLGLA